MFDYEIYCFLELFYAEVLPDLEMPPDTDLLIEGCD
jgi:hypothetical protein